MQGALRGGGGGMMGEGRMMDRKRARGRKRLVKEYG